MLPLPPSFCPSSLSNGNSAALFLFAKGMVLWMPYYISQDQNLTFSTAMDIFWICDCVTIGGCILTLISICKKEEKIQLAAILLLLIGVLCCILAGAIDSDEWCSTYFDASNSTMEECVVYIVFMYCLFMPLTIAYVILLILYRSHYTFSNIIFMRSKRMMYLMFVAALMMVPIVITMKWYISVIHYEWKAYWISIMCFDVFTWTIAFMYGFNERPPLLSSSNLALNARATGDSEPAAPPPLPTTQETQRLCGVNIQHPIFIGVVTALWVTSFISTLLWGLIGYSQYNYDTDDLLARYADYIMMVSVNLWIIGEVLSEDEGYVDIDIDYHEVPQIEDYSQNVDTELLL